MWQDQMKVGERQPELLFKPGQFFRKVIRLSGQVTIALALSAGSRSTKLVY